MRVRLIDNTGLMTHLQIDGPLADRVYVARVLMRNGSFYSFTERVNGEYWFSETSVIDVSKVAVS